MLVVLATQSKRPRYFMNMKSHRYKSHSSLSMSSLASMCSGSRTISWKHQHNTTNRPSPPSKNLAAIFLPKKFQMTLGPGGGNSPPAIRHFKKYKKFMQIATSIKTIYCTGCMAFFWFKYLCNFRLKLADWCNIMRGQLLRLKSFYIQFLKHWFYWGNFKKI